MVDAGVRVYYSGCNYYKNDSAGSTATSIHECGDCDRLGFCKVKQTTEVWALDSEKMDRDFRETMDIGSKMKKFRVLFEPIDIERARVATVKDVSTPVYNVGGDDSTAGMFVESEGFIATTPEYMEESVLGKLVGYRKIPGGNGNESIVYTTTNMEVGQYVHLYKS